MAAILKVWRHTRTPTASVDAYLYEEQPCQIQSPSDLKWRSLGLFLRRVAPTRTEHQEQQDEELYSVCSWKVKKVKGLDIYTPPLTGKPWPAAVYNNSKWRTDRQWHKWRSASSGSPLAEWTDFRPRSLQPDRPTYAPVCSRSMAFTPQCSLATTHYF